MEGGARISYVAPRSRGRHGGNQKHSPNQHTRQSPLHPSRSCRSYTIYPAISAFLAAETRLDILFNNAGRASLPLDYKAAQGLNHTLA